MKCLLETETVQAYIDLHKKIKLKFSLTISNYTTKIKSNAYDIHFLKTEQSNRMFAAYSMLKRDCLLKEIPEITPYDLRYYSQAFEHVQIYTDKVFNFDIKSAYASIMYNDGFISKKTYDFLCSMPKMDRLAALGMLAGQKRCFEFDENGEIISDKLIVSPTANYFYHAVKRTSDIIGECSNLLGNSFLFSWVDGIYFLCNDENIKEQSEIIINDFFAKHKLKCSFDVLTEFNVQLKKTHWHCTYKKDGNLKSMNVPKPENATMKKLINYLLKK